MRISELSRLANTPLSAVKFYQREGLLPEGVRTAPNQVTYGDVHVKRIRLVRALMETGGLSVAATREVIRALDADDVPLVEAFGAAQHAMSVPRITDSTPSAESREIVKRLAQSQGWNFSPTNPGIDSAARALDGLRAIDYTAPEEYLVAYAEAAASAAAADLRTLTTLPDMDQVAELMVVGTVMGNPLFAGLRQLAHEDATRALFPPTPEPISAD